MYLARVLSLPLSGSPQTGRQTECGKGGGEASGYSRVLLCRGKSAVGKEKRILGEKRGSKGDKRARRTEYVEDE